MHASRLPHVFSALESPPHAACVQHSSKEIPTAWKPNACLQIEFPAMSFPRGARVQWPVVQFRKLILSPCVSVVILIAYPPSKWLDGIAWHYLGIFPRPSPHVVYSPLRVHAYTRASEHALHRPSLRRKCGTDDHRDLSSPRLTMGDVIDVGTYILLAWHWRRLRSKVRSDSSLARPRDA